MPGDPALGSLLRRVESMAREQAVLSRCDMAGSSDCKQFCGWMFSGGLLRSSPRAVIHAAGLLRDSLLLNSTSEKVRDVFGPKVNGAWRLHVHLSDICFSGFLCFSSEAALIGNLGQTVYSSANAYLDGLVQW